MSSNQAVIYARVSSKEQEETGYSLPAQEKLITEYGNRKNYEIDRLFSIAESASGSKQRKVFGEMLDYIKKGGIKILLCEKVDRITRNFKEAIVINDWLEEDPDHQIHFVKQNLIISKNAKSDERFRWDIEIVLAKKYISNLSEEVKKGQKEKVAQGWLPTKPPIGYKTIGDKGKKIHVIDDFKAPLIRKMFELYATGEYAVQHLSKVMYEQGLRTRGGYKLVRSRISKIISDPFYIGMVRWNGIIYQGKQEPLISKDLFERVQSVLNNKTHAKHRTHSFLFKGLITCQECKGIVTWETQKGIIYGHCSQYRNCTKRSWYKQDQLERLVGSELSKLQLSSERLATLIRKAIKELHSTEINYRNQSLTELQNRQNRLRQQQDTLYSDRLDGRITTEFYDEKSKTLTSELTSIVEAIKGHSEADKKYYELGINIFELSQRATMIFDKAPQEDKRRLLTLMCDKLEIKDQQLIIKFTDAFSGLLQMVSKINRSEDPLKFVSPYKVFELQKTLSPQRQKGSMGSKNDALLRE